MSEEQQDLSGARYEQASLRNSRFHRVDLSGSQFRFVGVSLDTENHMSWLVSAAVLAVGLVGLEFARRAFIRVWSRAQEEIEAEIKQREPA